MEIEAEQNGAVQRLESDWSCNRNLSLAAAGLSVPPITFPRQLDEPGGECGRGVLALCFGDVRTVAAAFP